MFTKYRERLLLKKVGVYAGEKLKQVLFKRNLLQTELAREIGVNDSRLSIVINYGTISKPDLAKLFHGKILDVGYLERQIILGPEEVQYLEALAAQEAT